ncbi:hypothetical protein HFP43_03205 [Streptomyces sp. SJ1-7]|nr:hypothetical protein [Streptomyces sp. SJ1-7]
MRTVHTGAAVLGSPVDERAVRQRTVQQGVVVPVLGDHMHRGLLGRRRRAVDAHIAGGERGRDAALRLLGQPPGAGDADLAVPELAVPARQVSHAVAGEPGRLGKFPGQPRLQRLAREAFGGCGAESIDHPGPVRR